MAAPLGEKERAAAFAAAHPLACIDLCPPVIASVPAPETIFGYDCNTKNSYMLRVVHRGYMKEKSTWYGKRAEFVQHGHLALLKQVFPSFFCLLPVGLHLTARDAHFQAFASSASETLKEWARRPKLQATALPVTSTTEIATVQKSSKRIVFVSSDDDEPIVVGPPAPKRS